MKILAEDMHTLMHAVFAGGVSLKLTSEPGSGKSKGAEAYAAVMNRLHKDDGGYGCFILDLSSANFGDSLGYLMPTTVTDTDVRGVSQEILAAKYTYPYWAYDTVTMKPAYKFSRGLIIIEEWGQGDPEVKRALAPLVNDRRLGLWRFNGFDVVILSNRPEDRSGVTQEFDFIINRWCEAELVPTLKGFLAAGAALGMTPLTLAFAARSVKELFGAPAPENQGPWMTQRSLHKMDDVIKANVGRHDITDPIMEVVMAGTIGKGDAARYKAFADARSKIPTVSSIVSDPAGAPVPSAPDVLMFLVFDLASKTDRTNITAICQYIKRLSSGMQVTYFNACIQRDDTLVSTAEFSSFAVDNITLLSVVAARR